MYAKKAAGGGSRTPGKKTPVESASTTAARYSLSIIIIMIMQISVILILWVPGRFYCIQFLIFLPRLLQQGIPDVFLPGNLPPPTAFEKGIHFCHYLNVANQ